MKAHKEGVSAARYQAEWADEIRRQGRDPHLSFPVARARGYVLKRKSPPFAGIKNLAMHVQASEGFGVYVPLDAERDWSPRLHTASLPFQR